MNKKQQNDLGNNMSETKVESRKDTKSMMTKTGLGLSNEVQMLHSICKELEERFVGSRIYLDPSMIAKCKTMCETKEGIQAARDEIQKKVEEVYLVYLFEKAIGHLPLDHVAIITLFADEEDTLHVLSKKYVETENFDGIKRLGYENMKKIDCHMKREFFAMYNAESIVIDGIQVIRDRKIELPEEVVEMRLSEDIIKMIIKKYRLSLSCEEAMEFVNRSFECVPLKEDIFRWVRDKSDDYIALQPDTEEGRKNVANALERREKFFVAFSEMYDEQMLIVAVLEYEAFYDEHPKRNAAHLFLEQKIRQIATALLLLIKDMTEYEVVDCIVIP